MKLAELFRDNQNSLRDQLKDLHLPGNIEETEKKVSLFFDDLFNSNNQVKEFFFYKVEPILPTIANLFMVLLQDLDEELKIDKANSETHLKHLFEKCPQNLSDLSEIVAKSAVWVYLDWKLGKQDTLLRLRVTEFLEIIYQLCGNIDQLVKCYEEQSKQFLYIYENLTSIISRRVNKESYRDLQRRIGRKIYREGYKLATGKEFNPDIFDYDLLNGAPEEAYDQILESYSDNYQQLLKKDGISVIEYSDKDKPLFDVILSDEVSKITPVYPAFMVGKELYLKGLVYKPNTAEK